MCYEKIVLVAYTGCKLSSLNSSTVNVCIFVLNDVPQEETVIIQYRRLKIVQ